MALRFFKKSSASEREAGSAKMANRLLRDGKNDWAIKEYKRILNRNAYNIEVRKILADLYLKENKVEMALDHFNFIVDYYIDRDDPAKAAAFLKRMAAVEPKNDTILDKLASLYIRQRAYTDAKEVLLKLAELYQSVGNHEMRLGAYERILQCATGDNKFRVFLAESYLKIGWERWAVKHYLDAVEILLSRKKILEAEKLLLDLVTRTDNPEVVAQLILLYTGNEKEDAAMEIYERYHDSIVDTEVLSSIGDIYLRNGNCSNAGEVFLKVYEIEPGNIDGIARVGKQYVLQEEIEKAFSLFSLLADESLKTGNFEDAAGHIRSSLSARIFYPPALLKLAQIYIASSKTNSVVSLFATIIESIQQDFDEFLRFDDAPEFMDRFIKEISDEYARQKKSFGAANQEFVLKTQLDEAELIKEKLIKELEEKREKEAEDVVTLYLQEDELSPGWISGDDGTIDHHDDQLVEAWLNERENEKGVDRSKNDNHESGVLEIEDNASPIETEPKGEIPGINSVKDESSAAPQVEADSTQVILNHLYGQGEQVPKDRPRIFRKSATIQRGEKTINRLIEDEPIFSGNSRIDKNAMSSTQTRDEKTMDRKETTSPRLEKSMNEKAVTLTGYEYHSQSVTMARGEKTMDRKSRTVYRQEEKPVPDSDVPGKTSETIEDEPFAL